MNPNANRLKILAVFLAFFGSLSAFIRMFWHAQDDFTGTYGR